MPRHSPLIIVLAPPSVFSAQRSAFSPCPLSPETCPLPIRPHFRACPARRDRSRSPQRRLCPCTRRLIAEQPEPALRGWSASALGRSHRGAFCATEAASAETPNLNAVTSVFRGITRQRRKGSMGTCFELTAVSLFSGAGGMAEGFRQAGFEIVLASDCNTDRHPPCA